MKQVHVSRDGQTTQCGLPVKGVQGQPNLPYCHPERVAAWQEGEPVEGVEICPQCLTGTPSAGD